jgi:hypothetical protein
MKDGKNFNFDPGQQDIWLPYGDINNGLIDLLTGRGKKGHLVEFMELDPQLNNPYTIAKFMYERITKGVEVIMNDNGIVVYAFKFAGEDPQYDPHYLAVKISGHDMKNIGRIYTSFPVLSGSPNYYEYNLYFTNQGNNRPIETNVKIN